MKTRLLVAPLALALVVSLAACGGGGSSVPSNDVAVVDGQGITLATFNGYFQEALGISKAQGLALQPGTQAYTQKRDQTLAYVVEIAEVEQQAPKEGVHVSEADVTNFIKNKIAKPKFNGDLAKMEAAYKKQGLDMATLRNEVRINLVANKIKTKVTASATVSPEDEQAFYNANKSQFVTPAKLEIGKTKKLAQSILQQLRNGASFAKLAKKYSQDPGSAAQGGKYTATQGRVVPAYDKAAFSLKTGQLSGLINATDAANGSYGFFIMKPLGPPKKTATGTTRAMEHILVAVKTKPKPQTFAEAQPSIKSTLIGQKQQTLWQQWLSDLASQYKDKVSYQAGYAPTPTTAISTTTPTG